MQEYTEIDLKQVLLSIWKRAWFVVLISMFLGAAAFFTTRYCVTPLYTASVKMYVNNSTEIDEDITSSDLTASQSLVGTYIVILRSDVVLDRVAELTDLPYSAEQIKGMISAEAINNTEVFFVAVTNPDPKISTEIANAIAEVAVAKIGEIVSGSSVKIVEYAKVPTETSYPDFFVNTMSGVI